MAVTTEGRRGSVGLRIGPCEAEPFWTTFLRGLVKRGLRGVKLGIGDAHEGLKAALARAVGATRPKGPRPLHEGARWPTSPRPGPPSRPRPSGRSSRSPTTPRPCGPGAAVLAPQSWRRSPGAAVLAPQSWRRVADQLRVRWPKLGSLMDEAEAGVLAHMAFPSQHRTKPHSTG